MPDVGTVLCDAGRFKNPQIKQSRDGVTIQPGLCIYCAGRKEMIQECKNSIAAGDFKWIFACNSSDG